MVYKDFIDTIIDMAAIEWGYDDGWTITWDHEVGKLPQGKKKQMYSRTTISYSTTEKWAIIHLDPQIKDLLQTAVDIFHELGHPIVDPIWRGVEDWLDHVIRSKQKRAIIEEAVNTRENEVIDHLTTQVFRVRERYEEICLNLLRP